MKNYELIKENLSVSYKTIFGKDFESLELLPASGSNRLYFLIKEKQKKILGVYNPDKRENEAFIGLSKHFKKNKLRVPEILGEDLENNIYFIEYLGESTLYSYLQAAKNDNIAEKPNLLPKQIEDYYKKTLEALPDFQIKAVKDMDFSLCYPRAAFDRQSMMWDLNYFKYYFLKLAGISFDEQQLENAFQSFCNKLEGAALDFFLYRDFQSRNIMIWKEEPWFIDYQGGRRGALQYDVASLLYDAKADLSVETREELLSYYLDLITNKYKINRQDFLEYYPFYVLIRILQALGAYGFRGFYERKSLFLQSIPYALKNLEYILNTYNFPKEIEILINTLRKLGASHIIQQIIKGNEVLTVRIYSFSYFYTIPVDKSSNGGGFMFDCRALTNPIREPRLQKLTGRDAEVIDYLNKQDDIKLFLSNVFSIVNQSVNRYIERRFSSLMVSFGCTGGQHRSVYAAESLKNYLSEKYNNINIIIKHCNADNWIK